MRDKPLDYENPDTFCGKCKHSKTSTMCSKYKKYCTGFGSYGLIKLDECVKDLEMNKGMF